MAYTASETKRLEEIEARKVELDVERRALASERRLIVERDRQRGKRGERGA